MEFNPFKHVWKVSGAERPKDEVEELAAGHIINDAPPAADRAKSIVKPPEDARDALPPIEEKGDSEHEARVKAFLDAHGGREEGMRDAA